MTKYFKKDHTRYVRKYFVIFFAIIFFFISSSSADAYFYREDVLGVSDSNVNIPPTVEGPGIFLPDSPFYFFDRIKQAIRVTVAATPERKAKIYSQIAGERMAELRFMLERKNEIAARETLLDMSDNLKKAAEEIDTARFSGKDVSILAKEINDSIKEKQRALDELETQLDGELRAWVETSLIGVTFSKIKVENSLNKADFENEVKDDLDREVQKEIAKASSSAKDLGNAFLDLKTFTKEATEKSTKNREEILQKKIDEKTAELKKAQEGDAIQLDKQKRSLEEAKNILQKTEEILSDYQNQIQTSQFRPTGVSYTVEEVLKK